MLQPIRIADSDYICEQEKGNTGNQNSLANRPDGVMRNWNWSVVPQPTLNDASFITKT